MGESNLKDAVLAYLNGLPHCIAEKVLGCAEQIGRPDINGCIYGLSFRIELKDPDKPNPGPSKLQARDMAKWDAAGAAVLCSNDMDEIKEFIKDLESKHWSGYRY